MNNIKTDVEILKSLKNIEKKLDILIIFQKSMAPEPKINSEEKLILSFCNSNNTVDEITEQTKKTKKSVEGILQRLRNKGVIKSFKIQKKTVYSKV